MDFQYHPEPGTELSFRDAAIKPGKRYPCPCCGNLTFPVPASDALAYICPVCFWENDLFTQSDDEPSDENHGMTLNEARKNYARIGACRPEMLQYVRKPTDEERAEKNNE